MLSIASTQLEIIGYSDHYLLKMGVPPDMAKHLENAAFHERTLNLAAAADEIHKFRPVLESN